MTVATSAIEPLTVTLPSVSVLLPAWNEADNIGRCLDSLIALDWPSLEIIVCAGGNDSTLEIARKYEDEGVVVLEQQVGEGKQSALRRCFARSQGEIIYLTDADCIVPRDTFRAVMDPVVSREVDAATGTSCPGHEQRSEPLAMFQWSIIRAVERHRPSQSTGLLGRNCVIRRDALVEAGAFAERVPIGTDYHLAKTLLVQGKEIRFVSAPVITYYPIRPGQYLAQQSRWLRNIFLHGPRFGDHSEMISCARTVALGTAFYLWPLTWLWTQLLGVALWLIALGYLILVRARYARQLAKEQDLDLGKAFSLRLPGYTLLNVAAWAWPLIDAISSRRRLRW